MTINSKVSTLQPEIKRMPILVTSNFDDDERAISDYKVTKNILDP